MCCIWLNTSIKFPFTNQHQGYLLDDSIQPNRCIYCSRLASPRGVILDHHRRCLFSLRYMKTINLCCTCAFSVIDWLPLQGGNIHTDLYRSPSCTRLLTVVSFDDGAISSCWCCWLQKADNFDTAFTFLLSLYGWHSRTAILTKRVCQ